MEIATVGDWARRRAAEDRNAPALISGSGDVLTYGALAATLDEAARSLAASGIGRGSTVALLSDTRLAGVVAALAISEVAAVAPLNPAAPEAELRETLRRIEVDALAFPAGMEAGIALAAAEGLAPLPFDVAPDGPPGRISFPGAPASAPPRPGPDDIAFVMLTSGTTGRAKATAVPHRAMLARPNAYLLAQRTAPEDVGAVFAPLYVSAGWNYYATALASGSAMIVRDRFDAAEVLADIEAGRLTWLAGGPVFQRALLDAALPRPGGVRAPRLKFLRATSQPLSPELQEELERTFGVPCLPAYACTEAGAMASARLPGEGPRRPGTVGCAAATDIEIRDENGAPVPQGEIGEVAVRSDALFVGYVGDPEGTAKTLQDGWYRTGDLGFLDEEGALTLVGRVQEVINRGGEKVSPIEVETALRDYDDVEDCICFALPHPTLGEVPAAAVTIAGGRPPSLAALRAHLAERLAPFKRPVRIEIVREIPRSASGKPLRADAARRLGLLDAVARPGIRAAAPSAGSALERTVAGLWGELLGREDVGLEDDFFELGGDSLQAMRLVALIEEVTGVGLPMEAVFEAGATPSGMAAEVEAARTHAASALEEARRRAAEPAPAPPSLGRRTRAAARRLGLGRAARALGLRQAPKRHDWDGEGAALSAQGAAPTIDAVLERCRRLASGWEGERFDGPLPVFGHNLRGDLPPLFWCFNAGTEAKRLAAQLGARRPIYAVRSFNRVLADRTLRARYLDEVADLYAEAASRHAAGRVLFVGGNCGGADVAEAVARAVRRRGDPVARLFMLDAEPREGWTAGLGMFFGADSRTHNPFYLRRSPDNDWRERHGDVTWDFIPGAHGSYFQSPNLESFAARLAARMEESSA